jgi:hypothetical protein
MSETVFRMQNPPVGYTAARTSWGAIWAGVFTFAAIWAVFEALAVAIFPVGASTGMEIWTVVLTVIAMYIAGLETGRLAGLSNRHDGLIHGIIMFGLSVVSAIVISTLATGVLAGTAAAHGHYAIAFGPGSQWAEFFGLFLGWLAAMGGASTGVTRRAVEVRQTVEAPIQMRPAA